MNKLIPISKVTEQVQKIGITLLFLAIYRIVFHVPLPMLDQERFADVMRSASQSTFGQILGFVSLFSGGALSQSTIFGWGVMPYISASIIFQLLASVYPPLEKLQKEGESGRKKINEYTRYATVPICLFQSYLWVNYLVRPGSAGGLQVFAPGNEGWAFVLAAVLTMTAGTVFLMWLGEQIDEYGIGNGISLIIMAGILADMPNAIITLVGPVFETGMVLGGEPGKLGAEMLLALAFLFVAIIAGVVFI